jgi:putative transposase
MVWPLKNTAREATELLTALIKDIFGEQRNNCGTGTIKKALSRQNYRVSRRRNGKLMKEEGLFCKTNKKFKATTNSKHDNPVALNRLDREFTVDKPSQKWVAYITYIRTSEGWLYLTTVIDLF